MIAAAVLVPEMLYYSVVIVCQKKNDENNLVTSGNNQVSLFVYLLAIEFEHKEYDVRVESLKRLLLRSIIAILYRLIKVIGNL